METAAATALWFMDYNMTLTIVTLNTRLSSEFGLFITWWTKHFLEKGVNFDLPSFLPHADKKHQMKYANEDDVKDKKRLCQHPKLCAIDVLNTLRWLAF